MSYSKWVRTTIRNLNCCWSSYTYYRWCSIKYPCISSIGIRYDSISIWSYCRWWAWQSKCSPITENKIYVGSDDDKLYCLDALTGKLVWSYTTGSDVGSSPAVSGGRVYVGSYDSKIYCLDALSGTLIWHYTTGGEITSSPAISNMNIPCMDVLSPS
jgi:hypothetical protein